MKSAIESKINLAELKEQFDADGYAVARGLFSPSEIQEIGRTFEEIHAHPAPGLYEPLPPEKSEGDSLKVWPRVMQPHRFNAVAKRHMLHPDVMECLEVILGEPAFAAQSMYYFKPPGSRGQAMHQDNFYLLVDPGTCIAAWTAVDDSDLDNGGMFITPKTRTHPIACPDKADERESWTSHFVPPPKGSKPVLAQIKAGDTLFFNGSVIHGSGPNRSKTRFRRTFICHYVPAVSTKKISRFYLPLVNKEGENVNIAANDYGGPCGQGWEGAIHG